MALAQDQTDKLKAWFEKKNLKLVCPVCGQNNWASGDIIAAPVLKDGGFNFGGPTVPIGIA